MSDEFFIGWQGKAPKRTGRFLRMITVTGIVVAVAVAVAVPALQQTVANNASFDFGNVQEFSGVLVKDPVPMLISDADAVYLLVNPFKFGFDPALAEKHHLQRVTLTGTRIWRGDEEMIEAVPESVTAAGDAGPHPLGTANDLGEVTLRGEIVDSKCYLGVMNPGNLKPHRACAINCIQGGIPPVLLVRDGAGAARYYLLVGPGGGAINAEILPLVAEPVAVTGRLKTLGKQRILYCDPTAITRE